MDTPGVAAGDRPTRVREESPVVVDTSIRHRVYRILVGLGLLSYGLVHLVIGGLAVYVAVGLTATPTYRGALRAVAAQPLGAFLMWAMAIGLATLTGWQVLTAVSWRRRSQRWTRPVGAFGRASTYAVLALLALGTIRRSRVQMSAADQEVVSAQVLAWWFGRFVVLVIAVVVGGVGVAKVGRGLRRTFAEDLTGDVGRATLTIGTVGHVAKGLVLLAVGLLLVSAGLTRDPADLGGVDVALSRIRDRPHGAVALVGVALGLACFGAYCIVWAIRARVD